MKTTYHGGCHCGNVRYEADIDLSKGSFKCNCSICTKLRNWIVPVKDGDFRLLAGEDQLSDYQFGGKRIHHQFCRTCGVHSFGWSEAEGGGRSYAVQINCLDDVTVEELIGIPVTCADGRNDNWKSPPAETSYL